MGLSSLGASSSNNSSAVNTPNPLHAEAAFGRFDLAMSTNIPLPPSSCPPLFHASGKQQFSVPRLSPQQRGGELIVSKLLPTRKYLGNLMGYVRELQSSEAMLRMQLAKIKKDSEQKLIESTSRLTTLEESVQQASTEQERAKQTIAEQQRIIDELKQKLVSMGVSDAELEHLRSLPTEHLSQQSSDQPQNQETNETLADVDADSSPVESKEATKAEEPATEEYAVNEPPIVKPVAHKLPQLSFSTSTSLWGDAMMINSPTMLSPPKSSPPMFLIAPSPEDLMPIPSTPTPPPPASEPLRSVVALKEADPPKEAPSSNNRPSQADATSPDTAVHEVAPTQHPDPLPTSTPAVQEPPASETAAPSSTSDVTTSQPHFAALSPPPPKNGTTQPAFKPFTPPTQRALPGLVRSQVTKPATVDLKQLLVDFFDDVDKKKLKSADVYARRYVGHEDRLFAELTRRYGAEKVNALKQRFEGTATENAQSTATTAQETKINGGEGPSNEATPELAPGTPGALPPFIATAPALEVDTLSQSDAAPPVNLKVSPTKRQSQIPKSDHPPSVPPFTAEPPRSAPPMSPPPMNGFHGAAAPPPASSTSNAHAAPHLPEQPRKHATPPRYTAPFLHPPMDTKASPTMRESEPPHQSAAPLTADPQTIKAAPIAAKTSQVTLESLLTELYKKHQPDKLRNVAAVVREYEGKERELVRLLKLKYGALGVKRLEENLPSLEAASRRDNGTKKPERKRRGCFMGCVCSVLRLVSLTFWVGLIVSGGFIGLVEYECQNTLSDESVPCSTLDEQLSAFATDKIALYVHQTHPIACVCKSWKGRQVRLLHDPTLMTLVEQMQVITFSRSVVESKLRILEPYVEPAQQFVAEVKSHIHVQDLKNYYKEVGAPLVDPLMAEARLYLESFSAHIIDASVELRQKLTEYDYVLEWPDVRSAVG
ncbi:TPA: hypothetical protein N0F65_008766 [Lagenidium giganteum]|uniref:Uncharacterized protein n=1 Tax=Lagenidium giganteum TaxID=4803 RepID=A0AAV2Z5H1_9STRA|nr:TPA: hypothetical protein N0F65_008766 [Lagenidium giganteum]